MRIYLYLLRFNFYWGVAVVKKEFRELLQAPLTPDETRWVSDLADKLSDDVDLTFEESKMLTRLSIRDWPDSLVVKVKDVIDVEDFLIESADI